MTKEKILSLTAEDFDWQYVRGSGKGGQARNKTSNAVHCWHRPSGAHAFSQDGRSQLKNRQDAFRKVTNSKEFKNWLRIEVAKVEGLYADIEDTVNKQMKEIKVEVKENGKWKEE